MATTETKAPPTITTTDGTVIYYKDWGSGQPVVFSHGWPLNADAWDDQLFLVASNGFRAIAHDRRGHGRSSQPWDGNDLDTYADDLAELIEALDLRDVILVGHSTGGGEVDPLHRPPRHRAGGEGRPGRRDPAADAQDRRPTPEACRSRCSTRIRAGVAGRPLAVLQGPQRAVLRRQPDGREASRRAPRRVLAAGRCRPGSRARTTASRRSPRPTSPRTSSGSTCRP